MIKQANSSSGRLRGILLCCLGALMGLAIPVIGGWRRPQAEVAQAASPTLNSDPLSAPPRSVVLGPVTAQLGEDDKETLRRLIREELKSGQAAAAPVREEAPADPDAALKDLSSGQMTSYHRAQQLVDTAASSKRWREEDRQELRSTLAGLPGPLHKQVVVVLIDAVNKGQISWEGEGALF
jgi:hypothetical protein